MQHSTNLSIDVLHNAANKKKFEGDTERSTTAYT
ncbi:palindromic element RPE1 domain-containing protein [Rickettsia sp. R2]